MLVRSCYTPGCVLPIGDIATDTDKDNKFEKHSRYRLKNEQNLPLLTERVRYTESKGDSGFPSARDCEDEQAIS